jgi:hypothetical protein
MNNIKNACQQIKYPFANFYRLVLITLSIASGNCLAQEWGLQTRNDITLPKDQKIGYRPTLSFCIERDEVTGSFHAYNANQARFNQIWMDQKNAKQGSDAIHALVKMGIKHLYKSFYARSSGAKRFLPNEEGSIAVPKFSKYETDYKLHLRSDSVALGVAMAF